MKHRVRLLWLIILLRPRVKIGRRHCHRLFSLTFSMPWPPRCSSSACRGAARCAKWVCLLFSRSAAEMALQRFSCWASSSGRSRTTPPRPTGRASEPIGVPMEEMPRRRCGRSGEVPHKAAAIYANLSGASDETKICAGHRCVSHATQWRSRDAAAGHGNRKIAF